MAHLTPKSTENTVFVRFVPPSEDIRRHHVEDLFSQIGPIKKSAVIHKKQQENATVTSSYGFVRYTNAKEAQMAAKSMNNKILKVSDTVTVKVKVEVATNTKNMMNPAAKQTMTTTNKQQQQEEEVLDPVAQAKKTARVILRNLSFYATEKEIRKALDKFGSILDVHLPKVGKTSRGFAFVTFSDPKQARQCIASNDEILIHKRPVQIAYSLNKTAYESQKEKPTSKKEKETVKDDESIEKDDISNEAEEASSQDDESEASDKSEESGEDDDDASAASDDEKNRSNDDKTVAEQRCLFIRNVPFDTTQQELFEAFVKYGFITGAYLVIDKETKMPKGTAFVSYKTKDAAKRALDASKESSLPNLQEDALAAATPEGGIVLGGRRLLVDLAVDKDTANTLQKKDVKMGKDKRNVYLKNEGRVDNEGDNKAWDDLPEMDQIKRQRAASDKNTKLRSPIFFINPTRLNVRNLSKSVDEKDFKKLCVEATKDGLANKLVTAEDQITHWKASGEYTTKEILDKIQEAESKDIDLIPEFDDKNVKQYIPSVFIDRNYASASKRDSAPSRGFGFVEFTHHAHALACLRQLNNNIQYTKDYVQGGQQAMKLRKKRATKQKEQVDYRLPRLIVEFTVENKAKAKQQAEHRTAQTANQLKQKKESEGKKDKTTKSRGKRQREKRRERQDTEGSLQEEPMLHHQGDDTIEGGSDSSRPKEPTVNKVKAIKPPKKKKKIDQAEASFNAMVESYKEKFDTGAVAGEAKKITKRWFED